MWFWVVAALLVLVSLAALLRPLVARTVRSAGDDEATIEIFRRQLADIDADLHRGGSDRTRLRPPEPSSLAACWRRPTGKTRNQASRQVRAPNFHGASGPRLE